MEIIDANDGMIDLIMMKMIDVSDGNDCCHRFKLLTSIMKMTEVNDGNYFRQ